MAMLTPDPTTTPLLRIRPMLIDDIPAVQEIDRLSFPLPWPKSAFLFELQANKASRCWVAEWVEAETAADNRPVPQVVGVLVLWLILDEAHVATIAVHPERRGQHIGQALLQAALSESRSLGMLSATLEVRAGNEPAQRLYEKFGFEIVGRRPRYYQDNHEDALIMTAVLAD